MKSFSLKKLSLVVFFSAILVPVIALSLSTNSMFYNQTNENLGVVVLELVDGSSTSINVTAHGYFNTGVSLNDIVAINVCGTRLKKGEGGVITLPSGDVRDFSPSYVNGQLTWVHTANGWTLLML